ncbi:hypothetical protein [Streptomyces sp. NPDC004042]|uniref:hypothetical protein n=1 Tax=Streptomyces sp. NPDC004042 TaxID=3154451 RepID=UPI0033B9C9E8
MTEAHVGHTHLFPGARVRVDGLTSPRPCGLRLRFADGEETAAEVLVSEAGEAALAVEAYTTRAGTRLPARTWTVREHGADDGGLTLRLGPPLP